MCKKLSKMMQAEFEMSMMSKLKFFLDIQINQCKDEVYIHQSKYTKELFKKFNIVDCKLTTTHMHLTCNLSIDDSSNKVDQKVYKCMIGSILYLTASRRDTLFSVCYEHVSNLFLKKLTYVVKIIFRFMKGTTNLSLIYKKSKD